jgi:transcriptional regulator with GAF, ATPase, and Fis domain/truncated hemoglobin YjbI
MTTKYAAIENGAGEIVRVSQALADILEQVRAVATTDATVLIFGETGVGKELIARRIHGESRRCRGPMITVNCASIPRDLFESEFFGHVRGAFTGATRDRVGRIEAADEGTLFLDEVGEIPLELQGKLLRTLQHLSFERVGEDRARQADVRFIAATNRNLLQEISAGRFRLDLYYRLSVFPIEVPPLRARPEDITTLAQHLLSQLAARSGRAERGLSSAQVRHLQAYEWPGNVRELKNVLERAFILSGDGPLRLELGLPASALSSGRASTIPERLPMPAQGFFTASEFEQLERQNLIGVLEAAHWKISGQGGAAFLLGLKPSTLSSRLKALNIQQPEPTSLYFRLGGHKAIATFAHDIFGRVLADPLLSRFWAHRSTIGILREEQLFIAYLSSVSGGPAKYSGRDMKSAHRHLGITPADWDAFRGHLRATLVSLAVAPRERQEITDLAEGLRSEIVSNA